jgi:hypothetical protein
MAINSSISDMPWLGQPADLATSLLKGSQVGSSVVSAYLRARELRGQEALLPLRQQEMQAQIANAALDHQIKQEHVNDMLASKGATANYLDARSKITNWTDPVQTGALDAMLAKNPAVPQWIVEDTRRREADAMTYNARLVNAANADLYIASRESIAAANSKAANDRAAAANASREKISQDARVDRANLEVVRQSNRIALESGKTVKWPEFLNRHLKSYTDATGKTPEEAAKLLRLLYDENVQGAQKPGGGVVDPKDPANLFMPQ